MTPEISERAFKEAIECGLLQYGAERRFLVEGRWRGFVARRHAVVSQCADNGNALGRGRHAAEEQSTRAEIAWVIKGAEF